MLLADRHHRVSEGARGLLQTVFDQVFVVADLASLLEGAQRLSPVLVVVDVSLANGDMAELLHSIRVRAPSSRVLVLSAYHEPTVAVAVFAAGSDGLVLKRSLATDLLPAVTALLAGRRYISPVFDHDSTTGVPPRPKKGEC